MKPKYCWSSATESAELEGTWVIMNADNGTLTRLSGVSGYIWSMLREPSSVADVAESVVSEYEVTIDVATVDSERLLQELFEIGAVEYAS